MGTITYYNQNMATRETDYSKGIIYQIKCNLTGKIYYGSTCDLDTRIGEHISQHKNHPGRYSSSYVIEGGDYEVSVVELFPCETQSQLETRESFYIKKNECVNVQIPGRTKQEWHIENRDRMLDLMATRRENKSDEIKEYANTKVMCGCGEMVSRTNMSRHVKTKKHIEFTSSDAEEIKSEKDGKKIECECGVKVAKKQIQRHRRSNKHLNAMKKLEGL
jgi:hypothetical protein